MTNQRPLIIVSGTAHWGSRKLAEHHVARHLTQYARVLFVDPPVSPLTLRRRPDLVIDAPAATPRELDADLFLMSPVVLPGKDRRGMVRVTDGQVRRQLRRATRELGGEVMATILTLPQRYLFDRRSGGRRVYWAKDDHRAGAHLYGLDPRQLARTECRLVASAHDFLVCSDELANTWRGRGAEPVVLPNGCDVSHFAAAGTRPRPADVDQDRCYVAFVGTLADRIDADALLAVADRGIDVLLVGAPRRTSPWPELAALLRHPSIHHVGGRRYEELPDYLGAAQVGLLPYRVDEYNRGSFPLKLLEYLAAGLPVVSTDLPAVRWLDAPDVRVAQDPSAFADAVVLQLAQEARHDRRDVRRRFAAGHDWSQRAAALAALLGLQA